MDTTPVRESDGKGRHTTVSRAMIQVLGGGLVVDMPGVRGLGLWESEEGIKAAFSDVASLASECRFRDCQHENEPGCAVLEAVENGTLSPEKQDDSQSCYSPMIQKEMSALDFSKTAAEVQLETLMEQWEQMSLELEGEG